QPRPEGALASKARESLPGPHERVLRQLVGLCRVARESQAERVHPAHMLAIQRLERHLVAPLRTVDEVGRVRRRQVIGGPVRARAYTVWGLARSSSTSL